MLWLLRWVLLLAVLNTCLMRTASVAYFPYLRTLQYCDTPANPAATHTSDWSGSDHCGDLKLVTREAQAIVGLGRGVGLVAHCVSMPFLGRLGDTVGRRILLIIHFVGMLLESMINAANPSVPVFVLGCALRGALSSLWPALMSMIADLCRPEQRILAYGLVALATAVVGTVCFVAVTKHVLERHHSDYRPFWGVLTVFSLCGCMLACACPETLPPGPTTAAEGKESRVTRRSRLCMCARLFASCHALPGRADAGLGVTACGTVLANPVTRFLLLLSAPLVVALTSLTVLDGWAVLAYGWQQETVNYVKTAVAPAVIVSLAAALPLQRALGTTRLVRLGVLVVSLSMFLMAVAEFSVCIFVVALLLLGSATCLFPAVLLLLSTQAPQSQQASTQATFSAVTHGLAAGALALHGYLLKQGGLMGYESLPFAVSALLTLISVYVVFFAMPESMRSMTAAQERSSVGETFAKARGA